MEIEIKLDASGVLGESIFALFGIEQTMEKTMLAVYYDDEGRTLGKNGMALRFRMENSQGVVTVKQKIRNADGFSKRGEWECPAEDLFSGLEKAVIDSQEVRRLICVAKENGLSPIAEMSFLRKYAVVRIEDSEIEIAFDCGYFNGDTAFCEAELELVSGSEQTLVNAAKRLENELGMRPQPLSKLARALKER